MHSRVSLLALGALLLVGIGSTSCNLFSPLDHPSGDAQNLSAARACFDSGDFQCARDDYAKLSPVYSDTVNAEEGFMTLDQQGADMGAFMTFVGDMIDSTKGIGVALTDFANTLNTKGGASGEAKRVAIWNVYDSNVVNGAIGDTSTKSFVQFVTMTALAAEILAEAANGGTLTPSNLASNPSTCLVANCLTDASCNQPSGATLTTTNSGDPSVATAAPTNTNPSINQLYDSVDLALTALQNLGAQGKFSTATSGFTNILNSVGAGGEAALGSVGAADRCFRQELLILGLGTT